MPQRRFRWAVIYVPLTLLACAWFIGGLQPACEWQEVVEWIGARNTRRYTKLAVLGVACVCIVLIVRVMQDRSGDH